MLQLSENLYLLNSAVLQLTAPRDQSFGAPSVYLHDAYDHVRWGPADNQPNGIARLLQHNNQVPGQLEALRDMIFGSGLGFFQRTIKADRLHLSPYTDARLEDWADAINLQMHAIARIDQYVSSGNAFTRFIYDPAADWYELRVSDYFMTRVGKPAGRGISEYHVNAYFGELSHFDTTATERIPAYDPRDPAANRGRTVTMHHSRAPRSGNPYYAFPAWWCAQEWVELANLIPVFHKSGIQNGYNIKYLIRMPQDYFDREGTAKLDEKASKKKWADFSDRLSGWLSGQKNVNKSMLIKYMRGNDGKAMDNVDVVPLKNEMSDDAYAKVWEMANVSIANAMGMLPTLAGVNPGKGNDSGSQIRVMADYQQHFRTPIPRLICAEDVNLALKAMGYRDVIAAFREVHITTLDQNPTGAQAVVNHHQ